MKSCRMFLSVSGALSEASTEDAQFDCVHPFYPVKKGQLYGPRNATMTLPFVQADQPKMNPS